MTIEDIRNEFPQLSQKVYGKPLVYLDNAATSLRPSSVTDCWNKMSLEYNSNIHRAVHYFSAKATECYENARECVRDFIGAGSASEVVFTSGTTASINLVARCFGEAFIGEGDVILVDDASHHSNILPWQMLALRTGAKVVPFPVADDLSKYLTDRTKLVAVSHISNVLGIVNPVKKIIDRAHSAGVPVLVDGAQGIVHEKVDVKALGCDFYAFSGHKMYAAPGTGVLYGKKELLDAMPPFMGGGEMIGTVRWSGSTYAPLPQKFEAGTQNFASVPTFIPAIAMVRKMRDPEILALQESICSYMLEELSGIDGLRLYGEGGKRIPLFSFSVEGVHHEDLALILDKMGIAVRSGQMCAEPLMDKCGVTGMLRASFAPYNTMEEARYFTSSLRKAIKMLK